MGCMCTSNDGVGPLSWWSHYIHVACYDTGLGLGGTCTVVTLATKNDKLWERHPILEIAVKKEKCADMVCPILVHCITACAVWGPWV